MSEIKDDRVILLFTIGASVELQHQPVSVVLLKFLVGLSLLSGAVLGGRFGYFYFFSVRVRGRGRRRLRRWPGGPVLCKK